MRYLRWCGLALTALVAACALLQTARADGVLEPLGKERLGKGIYCVLGRNFFTLESDLYLSTVTHMVHGAGQGHNLLLWRRSLDNGPWQLTPIRPGRMPAMISVLPSEAQNGETLFLYVDRQDEADRVVYLERFCEREGLEEIFRYSNGSGVLNPIAVHEPDSSNLHVLIPDRTDTYIRWFRTDLEEGAVERLDDISMPREGARLYDYHVEDARLVLPTAVTQELHVLVIDLETMTHEMKHLDTAESPDNQPPRNMTIHPFPEKELYIITYLRPTDFSYRPETGLLGEVVANSVCMDRLESVEQTVIGGFSAEEAATHHLNSVKVSEDAFVMAYTTVDEVHQRHLTGEFQNYVSGHVDRWRLASDGSVTAEAQREMEPFWHPGLAKDSQGVLYMLYNSAVKESPKWLKRWRTE